MPRMPIEVEHKYCSFQQDWTYYMYVFFFSRGPNVFLSIRNLGGREGRSPNEHEPAKYFSKEFSMIQVDAFGWRALGLSLMMTLGPFYYLRKFIGRHGSIQNFFLLVGYTFTKFKETNG